MRCRGCSFRRCLSEHEGESGGHGSFRALLHYPQLWFAVAANVCNVGAQICMWSNIIFYMKAVHAAGREDGGELHHLLAGGDAGGTVYLDPPLMKYVSPSKLLGIYGAINVVLMAIAVTQPGMLGAWAIVGGSFFLSIMFPTIFALGLKGLGENTKLGGLVPGDGDCGRGILSAAAGKDCATRLAAWRWAIWCRCSALRELRSYGFIAPLILPAPGNTDPEAGLIAAEFGQGI